MTICRPFRSALRHAMLLALLGAVSVALQSLRAEEPSEEKTEELRIWDQEQVLLEKAAFEKDGFNPLERTLVGIVLLQRTELAEDEKTRPQTVDIGRFSTQGQEFVLRLDSADLLAVLSKAPARKPLTLTGTVRVNGKYFVARDVSLVVPGQGSSAPSARRRRGGL